VRLARRGRRVWLELHQDHTKHQQQDRAPLHWRDAPLQQQPRHQRRGWDLELVGDLVGNCREVRHRHQRQVVAESVQDGRHGHAPEMMRLGHKRGVQDRAGAGAAGHDHAEYREARLDALSEEDQDSREEELAFALPGVRGR